MKSNDKHKLQTAECSKEEPGVFPKLVAESIHKDESDDALFRMRSIPIEVDDETWAATLRQPGPKPDLEHSTKLFDLVLAYRYDDEKMRLFGMHTADQAVHDYMDSLLETAVMETQIEGATVTGIILKLVNCAVESHPMLGKQLFGLAIDGAVLAADIRAEMARVSRTLARLQEQLDATLQAGGKSPETTSRADAVDGEHA
jgi:hypothetical protein